MLGQKMLRYSSFKFSLFSIIHIQSNYYVVSYHIVYSNSTVKRKKREKCKKACQR